MMRTALYLSCLRIALFVSFILRFNYRNRALIRFSSLQSAFLQCCIPGFLLFASVDVTAQENYQLWYTHAAQKWTDALPLGNGRIGAMVYGGVREDHIQFNEETLWTGKAREYNRKGAYKYLAQIRQLLFDGKQKEAEELAEKEFMGMRSRGGDRQAWIKEVRSGKGINGNPALPAFDDTKWKTLKVPVYEGWETAGLDNIDGAVWFRTQITIPDDWLGKDLILDLNRIYNQDLTYVNGHLVGNTDNNEARKYTLPAKLIHKGLNTIAIQVLNYADKGGILGYKDTSKSIGIYPVGQKPEQAISLPQQWKYKIQNTNTPEVAEYQASYQPFGDLNLHFPHDEASIADYKRSLDLSTATAGTSYKYRGINYQREYFVSQPHDALVVHLSASKLKAISFTADLSSVHPQSLIKAAGNHTLILNVQVKDGALKGESRLTAVVKNGAIKVVQNRLQISNADEVTLYLTAGTNFVTAQDVSANPSVRNEKALLALNDQAFSSIKAAHLKEYQPYYNRFQVSFGPAANENLPTDERLAKFGSSKDAAFAALYMQYGRYLLISSSRPGTQPANLQGIWNDLLSPPWGSKYTTNINLEMNYWPTEILNLQALNEPLFSKIRGLSQTGAATAKEYYNARGWVLHHNTDIWNGTAPINASNHGIWVTGAGWLSQHLWEHYRFSLDTAFLRRQAYPLMKGAALFFEDFLAKDPETGWLISTPSNSPENGGLVAGPTMDHQIIRTLFNNCLAAAKVLQINDDFTRSIARKALQIAPNQIGKYGQLQEWLTDLDDTSSKHRHVSHLWGLYPGDDITWDKNKKMMEAAKQSLLYRGDEATGWSLAWKINFWARFKDGDHAMELVKMLLKPASTGAGSYVNLFDAHPPFQIDGNFGGAAGLAELIVQSHQGYIDLLPALPAAIPEGEMKGLLARGGYEIDLKWAGGQLKDLVIKASADAACEIRYGAKRRTINVKAGGIYKLNGELQ
jgi:alpha-L-fucosidase 2